MNDNECKEILQKAKPILFNTKMVRAILDSRKTVTRRVVKPYERIPKDAVFGYTAFTPEGYISVRGSFTDEKEEERYGENFFKLPHRPGDILYVRETWQDLGSHYAYKADEGNMQKGHDAFLVRSWCPSIHMSKEAARIFLRVTNVRVERLQDITEEQARKEGIDFAKPIFCKNKDCDLCNEHGSCQAYVHEFKPIWNKTIKKSDLDKYEWAVNPWVWVIEFERID